MIKSKYIVYTTGFEFKNKNLKNINICKTFTIVTNPIKEKIINNYTGRDMEDPYHYIRFTDDNRIIFGGEDIRFIDNNIKLEKIAKKKYHKLYQILKRMYKNIKFDIDYTFNGTFINTNDTLPIIDELDSNVFCNLGYGANGILYSVIGAKEIYRKIKEEKKLSSIYRIDR